MTDCTMLMPHNMYGAMVQWCKKSFCLMLTCTCTYTVCVEESSHLNIRPTEEEYNLNLL